MTRRLLLSYLTITVIVLVLLGVPLAIFYEQRELDRFTTDVERDATVLATIYEDALETSTSPDPRPADDYATRTASRVVVVDPDGISVIDTSLDVRRDFSTRPEIEIALRDGVRATGTRFSETLDTDLLYVAVPVASGGTVHGALRITLDVHEVQERVWRFRIGLGVIATVVLTVMAGVGWVIARSVTRPVRQLQAAATRFSGGDLTPTEIDEGSPPELAALARAMNDMAARLDELIERQRSFVSDASHQLRTPLTALRLRLENLQFAVADPSQADQLAVAIEESNRLSLLVNDLLQLARTEKSPAPQPTNISDVVRDRVDIWSATAEQHGVTMELDVPPAGAWAMVIPGGLEQVLDNLIDNAIRAAPANTAVRALISARADFQCVAITDSGSGLADEAKELALKRFWRSDNSTPGTGLGLAIADAIVRSSGGTIELTDNNPCGLVVTVMLPTHTHQSPRRTLATNPNDRIEDLDVS